MKAVNLRTEQLREPMGIDVRRPYVSWNCADGITQTAYELKAVSGDQEIYNSGKVESNKMNAALEAELGSRQSVSWQVRLWDENNEVGEWSQEAFFEMGLLEGSDFCAKWINPELTADPDVHKQASCLSTSFS